MVDFLIIIGGLVLLFSDEIWFLDMVEGKWVLGIV